MEKKVPAGELALGMYVVELERPWLDTPLLPQGFSIDSAERIAELRQYCRHVYVDPLRSSPLARNEQDQRRMRTIIDLAHNLGLVAVEGVDEAATLQLLRDMGCDVAQGHYIRPPLRLEDFPRFLETNGAGSGA